LDVKRGFAKRVGSWVLESVGEEPGELDVVSR
jgi:hypothetical protein